MKNNCCQRTQVGTRRTSFGVLDNDPAAHSDECKSWKAPNYSDIFKTTPGYVGATLLLWSYSHSNQTGIWGGCCIYLIWATENTAVFAVSDPAASHGIAEISRRMCLEKLQLDPFSPPVANQRQKEAGATGRVLAVTGTANGC